MHISRSKPVSAIRTEHAHAQTHPHSCRSRSGLRRIPGRRPALGGAARKGPQHSHTEADANGDGRVTRREYDAHRDDIFAKLDRNGNGVASEEDAPKIRIARKKFTEKLEQVLAMADKNGDGLLSRAEWDKPERDIFALIDQDEDGVIILADLPVL